MIRRLFSPLIALAVVAAVLIASAPAEAGPRKVALGVWIPSGNRNMDVYRDFGNTVGRQPALVTMSVQWGATNRGFPRAQAEQAKARGSRVMITWTPTINPISKETGKYARFKNIVRGKHDKYIKSFARAIKRFGAPVYVRPFHEVNATFFPWSRGWGNFYNPETGQRDRPNDNNPKLYKKAWLRVNKLFKQVGANNAYLLWTVAKQSCGGGCNPYKKWYPPKGTGVFNAGFSNFNWGGFNGRRWNTFPETLKQPMKNFNQFTKKPIILAELGTTDQSGGPNNWNKSQWLNHGYPAVFKKYPRIKTIVYQHFDTSAAHGHPNWSLNAPAGSINAYKNLLTQKRFKGKINRKGKVR